MVPALFDLEGFGAPGADNAVGEEHDEADVDEAEEEVGDFAKPAVEEEFEQAEDGGADDGAVEGADAADEDHEEGGDGVAEAGDGGADDGLVQGV